MRNPILAAAIAAVSLSAAAQESPPVPAQIICRDGRPVAITLMGNEPGVFTLQLPPDICLRPPTPPVRPARPSASSSSRPT